MITYNSKLASSYNDYHSVPGELFSLQIQKILSYLSLDPTKRVLDVGCGSGRLLIPIHRTTQVFGVEKSTEMFSSIPQQYQKLVTNCSYQFYLLRGLTEKFSSAYFSFSLHQISPNKNIQLNLLKETFDHILEPGGSLLLITLTEQQIGKVSIAEYFPSVVEIDTNRFLSLEDLKKEFQVDLVDEQTLIYPMSKSDFLEKVEGKYISTLQMVSPKEYDQGVDAIKNSSLDTINYVDCYSYIILREKM